MAKSHGLIIVNTGEGKGKTTAALGLAMRALGNGYKVLMVQFIKGGWEYGELKAANKFDNFELIPMGEGFIWKKDEETIKKNARLCREALEYAYKAMVSNEYFMIILDEINYAISYELLAVNEVIDFLKERPENVHVVLTGRDVKPEIIEKADLVTEMTKIKHPFDIGIDGQKGIEF